MFKVNNKDTRTTPAGKCRLGMMLYCANLASAVNFLDAFRQMSLVCFTEFSLLSELVANNFFMCKLLILFLRWPAL